MRTSPEKLVAILEVATFEDTLPLRSSDLKTVIGKLDWKEAYGYAIRGEIEGVGKGANPIRYFRVLPESERPLTPPAALKGTPVFKTREPIGAALQPFYEEHIGQFMVGTLCRVTKGGQLLRWDEDQKFNPKRFNPDKIAPSIIPGLRKKAA